MINFKALEKGDILLFKRDSATDIIYAFIENKLGKPVANLAVNLTDSHYVHAALYLGANAAHPGYFWTLEAINAGVYIVERPVQQLKYIDVYRYKYDFNKDELIDIAFTFWNKPYDWQSLILNGIAELSNIIGFEEFFEDILKDFDTPQKVICSELIVRIYKLANKDFKLKEEFTSPDDISKNPYLFHI